MSKEKTVVNYDVIGSITQFLILAAMKKQVVLFSQLEAACQHSDLDQVLRGNLTAQENMPRFSNDAILAAIDVITQECVNRKWPPLTVLITKDGKNVGQGFWEKGPYGNLQDVDISAAGQRHFELQARKECYRYFDAFSPMNEGMRGYIAKVWRAVEASAKQFPDLKEALTEACSECRNGNVVLKSDSGIMEVMKKTLQFDLTGNDIVGYDTAALRSHRERNTQHFSVVVPLNKHVEIVSRALAPIYATLGEGEAIGFPCLEKMEVLGVVTKENTTLLHKDFVVVPNAAGDDRLWNITGAIYKVLERGTVVPEGEDWAYVAGQVNTYTGEAVFSVDHPTADGLLVRLSIYIS